MENNGLVKHSGGCHCGAVRFTVLASSKITIYVCNCSICTKKQIKGFIVSDENFELLQGKDNLIQYTFNTGGAKHLFCKTCGVQSFYKPRSNPEGISVMTYCIDPGTITEIKERKFDGQNWEESMKNEKPMHS
ncbi:centromere protein V [Nephila pilipes]|uniref:Centromere protein V n=1 Tax=Nephila pilipes TaxID=299642 RepID=A0A8X6MV68_NEPPI|nr:centromere protein V [Nephila pilipes]GFS78261.1 centromere protein V [Nephila pilipes]GFS79453.1 centromere protein V [Nephila pilipes]GFT20276.1 centromere protein V [Nephila pilipes]